MRVMQVVSSHRVWGGMENLVSLLANELAKTMVSFLLARHGHPIFSRLSKKVYRVPMTIGSGFNPCVILPFLRLVQREKIDLIDFHSSHGHNLALFVRLLSPRVKIVVHRHNDIPPAVNFFSRYKYQHGGIDRFICVSQAVRKKLLCYGIAPKHAVTVLGAVPARVYDNRTREQQRREVYNAFNLDHNLPLIGTAASLCEWTKGYDTLLQALSLLKRTGTSLQAVFCGEGRDREKLENTCHTLNLQREVHFAGFVEDVGAVLAAVDVFCFPSRHEALGLAVQEAAHAGCCIIATAAGGIVEMIKHEHNGLLSEVGNTQQLAANLKRVLLDKDTRRRLAENSRQDIGRKFSIDKMITSTTQIYKEVLNT